MRFSQVIKMFKKGNVCVTGLRGSGKDLLFANVIARRKSGYISNFNYHCKGCIYTPLDLYKLNVNNSYINLINNDINYYSFPYTLGDDIYLSDAGIYLPSQYCGELNKKFPFIATYQALSRQVSHNNFHINVQNLNRLYDKVREQSDIFISCQWSIYFFGFVIQKIILYDKYDSCVSRVKPCRIRVPLFASKEVKLNAKIYRDKFYNTYGSVKSRLLIYRNRSKYDTLYFEKLFKGGKKKND